MSFPKRQDSLLIICSADVNWYITFACRMDVQHQKSINTWQAYYGGLFLFCSFKLVSESQKVIVRCLINKTQVPVGMQLSFEAGEVSSSFAFEAASTAT